MLEELFLDFVRVEAPVPPRNLVQRAIVDVSVLGVKLAAP
jgi:hypothetical protein